MKDKLVESHEKVEEVRKLEKKRDECVTRLDAVRSTKSRLEKEIKTKYPHPTEKLLQMLSSFERDLQVKTNIISFPNFNLYLNCCLFL